MSKRLWVLSLILAAVIILVAGCGSKTDPAVDPAPEPDPEPVQNQEQPPEVSADVLADLADNRSAAISTAYQAYGPFSELSLGATLDEAVTQLTGAGMAEKEALADTVFGTQSCYYGFADEMKDVYIELEFSEGILIKKAYHVSFFLDLDTGFHPTKAIYNAMLDKMKDGSVNTLNDVEAYFGESYLQLEGYKDKEDPESGIKRTYRWRGGTHNIDVFTDHADTLTGFKIGSSALPE